MFGTIFLPNAKPPTRRSHKKSRNGCLTCKARKLKCDEVKPVCGSCERHFIEVQNCRYDRPAPPSAKATDPTHKVNISRSASSTSKTQPKPGNESPSITRSFDLVTLLPRSPSAEFLDPFITYPITEVLGADILMRNYLKSEVHNVFPWNPSQENNPMTTYYVPLVWSDRVLFHAVLQLSAIRLAKHGGLPRDLEKPGPAWPACIEVESIRLLRDRVEKGNLEEGVSDQTISAVATIAAIEHERGNLRGLKVHINGLKRMLDIRGGLNAIRESNPMVANSVFWIFVVAIYESPFPNLDPFLPSFLPKEHNLSHFQDFGPPTHNSPLPLDLTSLGVVEPIALILNSVQHVSQLVPTFSSYPTAATSMVMLTRMCTLLSHLLSLPPINSPDSLSGKPNFSSVISESARYAILLHVFSPWRGLQPDGSLTINHLLHRFIHFLKELMSFGGEQNIDNDLVLWIFATGGVAALRMPERRWFVSHIADITERMGITNWDEFRASISRGIWHERLLGRLHKSLWDEVEAKRGLVK